jgi:hypothetical protein
MSPLGHPFSAFLRRCIALLEMLRPPRRIHQTDPRGGCDPYLPNRLDLPNRLEETVRKASRAGQSPRHQRAHRHVDERLAALRQPLIVFAHPPVLMTRSGNAALPSLQTAGVAAFSSAVFFLYYTLVEAL